MMDLPGLDHLPERWRGPVLLAVLLSPYLTRAYHALATGGGLRGIVAAIWWGTNTPAGAGGDKVRYGDFTTLTRQFTVEEPLTEASDIYRLACFLLGRERLVSRPLRLLGLGVSSLREPAARQLLLL